MNKYSSLKAAEYAKAMIVKENPELVDKIKIKEWAGWWILEK